MFKSTPNKKLVAKDPEAPSQLIHFFFVTHTQTRNKCELDLRFYFGHFWYIFDLLESVYQLPACDADLIDIFAEFLKLKQSKIVAGLSFVSGKN